MDFRLKMIKILFRVEKYTSRKILLKLHSGPEWRIFHILTSEDIDDVTSRFLTVVGADSRGRMVSDRLVYIIKRKLYGGLKI